MFEDDVVIRRSTAYDEPALRRLAQLDDRRMGRGEHLVAEVAGEMRAAVSLVDGVAIADPWHRTADLVELLRLSAARAGEARPVRPRVAVTLGLPAPA